MPRTPFDTLSKGELFRFTSGGIVYMKVGETDFRRMFPPSRVENICYKPELTLLSKVYPAE